MQNNTEQAQRYFCLNFLPKEMFRKSDPDLPRIFIVGFLENEEK